ncbi:phage tail length tape measure family protein [Lysobacter sp. CA199]|uniref:phage tail length tape measure family protein n=1 Tax=Lysobacter sp. CA199 TaxID=3455608 RepID=UPI003F8CFD9F
MNLALRVSVDMKTAADQVRAFDGDIDRLGKTAGKTGDALKKVGTADLSKTAASARQASTGLAQTAESADEAASRIREMVRASLDHQRAVNQQIATQQQAARATRAGAAASAEQANQLRAATQAAYAQQAQVTAQIRSIADLSARAEGGARSLDDLADTERRLDRAMAAGLVTAEEQADILVQLDKQHKQLIATQQKEDAQLGALMRRYDPVSDGLARLARDETRLKAAVDSGRISREQYNRAIGNVAGERARIKALQDLDKNMRSVNLQSAETQRNLAQLVGAGVTGQWQLAGSQLLQIGNSAGIAGTLFTGLGAAIAATLAVVVGFGAAATSSYMEIRSFDAALISTGNAVGKTSGELANMADEIGAAGAQYSNAEKALQLLVSGGRATGDSLDSAATAAVNLAQLTGRSIDETVGKVQELAKSPTAALLELNEQYHFLTAEVFENVRSLEEQGRVQDAAKLATDSLAKATSERVEEMRAKAGALERAWVKVKESILGTWEAIKLVGRDDIEGRIKLAQADLDLQKFANGGVLPDNARTRMLREQLAVMQGQKKVADDQATTVAYTNRIIEGGIKAQAAIRGDLTTYDKEIAKQKELNELRKKFVDLRNGAAREFRTEPLLKDVEFSADGRVSGGAYDKVAKGIEDKYKERTPRKAATPKDPDRQAKQELEDLKRQVALLGELEDGEKRVAEAERIRYEISDGKFKNSPGSLKQDLAEQAQLLDVARKRTEAEKELKDVNVRLLQMQGQTGAAEVAKATQELTLLQTKLRELNDPRAANVGKLIDLTRTKADLDELERSWQRVLGEITREQQRVQAEQQAGLITEYDAQQRIVDLYREKGVVMGQLLPQAETLAQKLGDPAALENVRQMRAEFQNMQLQTDLLAQTIGTTFQGAASSALDKLVAGTASLSEAVSGFLTDMARGLAQFATAQLAQMAQGKLLSLLNRGKSNVPGLQSPDPAQAAAAGVAYAAPISSAALALGSSAIPLQAAAAALAAAASQLAISGAAGGGGAADGGGGGGGWMSLVKLGLSYFGGSFAGGGRVRGPGTSTSDSITANLSNDEYVVRAASVRRYGVGTLDAINAGTWPALKTMTPIQRPTPKYAFADGGLVTAGGPPMASSGDRYKFIPVFDRDQLAQEIAKSEKFEKVVVAFVGSNGTKIRGEWEG